MIRIFLLLLFIIIAFFGLRKFLKTSPKVIAGYIKTLMLCIAGLAVFYLTVTGRLNWLFAIGGMAVAFILRSMPIVLRYAPYLQRLWSEFNSAKQSTSQGQNKTTNTGDISIAEALEVLGLKIGATEAEIIAAHRNLMQKNHPDRGGSNYLAAKINQAKKILLRK